MADTLKGWRTLGFAVFLAVAGVLQAFDWATVIPANASWRGTALMAIGAVIAALRYVTTTAVGTSK